MPRSWPGSPTEIPEGPNINGPDYGALSAAESEFGSSQSAVETTVRFVLTLTGAAPSVEAIDAGNVVLAFGSPTEVRAVPDGGATAVLLGMAMLGLSSIARRRK